MFAASRREEEQRARIAEWAPFEVYDLNEYFENAHYYGRLDPVVGNYETRVTAMLAWLISETSVILRGESGTGKTKIMNAIVGLMWGDEAHSGNVEEVYPIYETSDKGLMTYSEAKRIERATYCFIPEIQNVKGLTGMVKHWTEGKPEIYKRQDRQRINTEQITLKPLPILTCLAEGNEVMKGLGAEMKRRFLNVWTTNSKKQNELIQLRKAQMRLLPESELRTMSDEKILLLRSHLHNVKKIHPEVIVNPCILEITKAIPTKYVVSNSYTDFFFDAIESVTEFYYSRNIFKDGRLFATPHDNKIAWIIVGPQMVDSCLSLPYGIGRTILGILPQRTSFGAIGSDTDSLGFDIQEISDVLDADGQAVELGALQEIMNKLVMSNFAKFNSKTKKYFKTQEVGFDNVGINWSKMVDESIDFMVQNYPHLAEEYEAKYCSGKGLEFVHPFTGVRTSILTDRKVRDDTENEELNHLNEMFTNLTPQLIETASDYIKRKGKYLPKLFFLNDIEKMMGTADKEQLAALYDILKEGLK